MMISKLWWHNYDKPYLYSFEGEGKEHRGGRKEKIEKKRGRGRNKKISPATDFPHPLPVILSPGCIDNKVVSKGVLPHLSKAPSFT